MKTNASHAPRDRRHSSGFLAGLVVLALAAGCVNTESDRGVEPRWQGEHAPEFVPGQTTRTDVLRALGPPSQIMTLGDGTVFYYMLELTDESGLILLVYNTREELTRYNRAVYFFDADGVLTDFAHSADLD